jgi:hypothetical protein
MNVFTVDGECRVWTHRDKDQSLLQVVWQWSFQNTAENLVLKALWKSCAANFAGERYNN